MLPVQVPAGERVSIRNRCDYSRIDEQFPPLVEAVVAANLDRFSHLIIDIRLQGSVARGDAVAGRSDIDFTALLEERPSEEAMACLQRSAEELQRRYPVVSRVDMDAVAIHDLVEFQRFVLSSDSLSLSGTDRLTRRVQRVDRVHLAKLVAPDAAEMIFGYRELVHEVSNEPDALRFYGWIIAKDLMKCMRFLVLMGGGPYEVTVVRMHRHAERLVPELEDLADDLACLYARPPSDPDPFQVALNVAETAMLPLIQSTQS